MGAYVAVPRPIYGYRGKTPDRVLDLLETEGEWLTVEHMALRLQITKGAVQTALQRLRKRGFAENRERELAGADVRFEWRITKVALATTCHVGDVS